MIRQEALAPPEEEMDAPSSGGGVSLRQSLRRYKAAFLSLVFLGVLVVTAATAPLISPHDPGKVSVGDRLKPAFWARGGSLAHPLGTDSLGRDILSRLIYGARVSILGGVASVGISGALGTVLGLVAGFFGGKLDDLIMGAAEIQLAFPFILLAITAMAVLGPGLLNVILVLGISRWVAYGRVVRGQVLTVREK